MFAKVFIVGRMSKVYPNIFSFKLVLGHENLGHENSVLIYLNESFFVSFWFLLALITGKY